MMRVISSPSSSTTGLATLILSMTRLSSDRLEKWGRSGYSRARLARSKRSVKASYDPTYDPACRHPVPAPDGGKCRGRRPGDEEFRSQGTGADRPEIRMAQ